MLGYRDLSNVPCWATLFLAMWLFCTEGNSWVYRKHTSNTGVVIRTSWISFHHPSPPSQDDARCQCPFSALWSTHKLLQYQGFATLASWLHSAPPCFPPDTIPYFYTWHDQILQTGQRKYKTLSHSNFKVLFPIVYQYSLELFSSAHCKQSNHNPFGTSPWQFSSLSCGCSYFLLTPSLASLQRYHRITC